MKVPLAVLLANFDPLAVNQSDVDFIRHSDLFVVDDGDDWLLVIFRCRPVIAVF